MNLYWNKEGKPITHNEWADLFEDNTYRRVGDHKIGKTWISTVWLGLDLSARLGEPVIFETMVFDTTLTPFKDLYVERYTTLERAQAGHDRVVAEYLSSEAD